MIIAWHTDAPPCCLRESSARGGVGHVQAGLERHFPGGRPACRSPGKRRKAGPVRGRIERPRALSCDPPACPHRRGGGDSPGPRHHRLCPPFATVRDYPARRFVASCVRGCLHWQACPGHKPRMAAQPVVPRRSRYGRCGARVAFVTRHSFGTRIAAEYTCFRLTMQGRFEFLPHAPLLLLFRHVVATLAAIPLTGLNFSGKRFSWTNPCGCCRGRQPG